MNSATFICRRIPSATGTTPICSNRGSGKIEAFAISDEGVELIVAIYAMILCISIVAARCNALRSHFVGPFNSARTVYVHAKCGLYERLMAEYSCSNATNELSGCTNRALELSCDKVIALGDNLDGWLAAAGCSAWSKTSSVADGGGQ